MDTYCLKCKKKTNTSNIKTFYTKKNQPMIKGKCIACKNSKTKFLSKAEESSLKKGGFIFTVPALMAGIGALGSIAGASSAIASAVNKKKADDKLLAETKRHNKAMESGKGLFLPKRKGTGLYLKPYKK